MSRLALRRARVPHAVPEVRAEARAWAADEGLPGRLVDDLALVVTELATNAVRHGSGAEFEVRLARGHGEIRVEVADAGPHGGARPSAPDGPSGGHGLVVVAALAQDHGRTSDDTGTVAWAVLDHPPGPHAATLRPFAGP